MGRLVGQLAGVTVAWKAGGHENTCIQKYLLGICILKLDVAFVLMEQKIFLAGQEQKCPEYKTKNIKKNIRK